MPWPEVKKVMALQFFKQYNLSNKSIKERQSTIGGSDINILASGDQEAIGKLFDEKESGNGTDLTLVWPVIMGHITEVANTEWAEIKQDISIVDRQRVIVGKQFDFMRCTLDGWVQDYKGSSAVFDAKFTLGRPFKGEEYNQVIPRLIRRYTPQLHWNAYLVSEVEKRPVDYGLLSIIRAGNEPSFHEIKIDPDFTKHLIGLAAYFIGCLAMGVRPKEMEKQEIALPPEERLPVDMEQSWNKERWRQCANVYIQTAGAAESFKQAEKDIKKLVPPHASEAFGHGIKVTVAKNNSKRVEVI